jgi:thymidylate synthase (FAD)
MLYYYKSQQEIKMKVTLRATTTPTGFHDDTGCWHELSSENYITYCARVSSFNNRLNCETAPRLLKYLIDSGHWSPFEMVSTTFEIETSRTIAQQLIRHRSFSFQEFSQRYAEVQEIELVELRYRSEKNRQSSNDVCKDNILNKKVAFHLNQSKKLYKKLLDCGIARECARMVLPLATQTVLIMHGTLRSWIHFLNQRCDDHAQKEIRLIADEIKSQLSKIYPQTAKVLKWSE